METKETFHVEQCLKMNNTFWHEKVVCAAVYVDDGIKHSGQPLNIENGFVVQGRRHSDCYSTLVAVGLFEKYFKGYSDSQIRKNQGFVTSRNRFIDRREAFIIALESLQLNHRMVHETGDELISEELWHGFDTQADIVEFEDYCKENK